MTPPNEQAPGSPGLEHDPFQPGCAGDCFYNEAVRGKRLNLLLHLAPYNDLLLVLGEEGSGKTCLLQRFLTDIPETWRVCHLQGTPDIDGGRLLDVLDMTFSLRLDGQRVKPEERPYRVRDRLHALRRGSVVPLLIVDDAHQLAESVLQMLSVLVEPRDDKEKLLGVILFGEAGLAERLDLPGMEGLRSRIGHSFDLPPLSEESTGGYIRHRLAVTGSTAGSLFTPSVIKSIHAASRGVPGRINEHARSILRKGKPSRAQNQATSASRHKEEQEKGSPANDGRGSDGPEKGVSMKGVGDLLRYGTAALVITLAVVALVYQDELRQFGQGDGGTNQDLVGHFEPQPPFRPVPGPDQETSEETSRKQGLAEKDIKTDPETPTPAERGTGARSDGAPPALPVPEGGSRNGEGVQSVPPADEAHADAAAGETAEVLPERLPVRSDALSELPALSESADADQAEVREEAPRGEDWLLAQRPGDFTLQLLAGNEQRAIDFMDRYGLADDAALFQTRSGDRWLFAVTSGVYPSRIEALRASEAPEIKAMRGITPWVRSFGEIQGVITARQTETAAQSDEEEENPRSISE